MCGKNMFIQDVRREQSHPEEHIKSKSFRFNALNLNFIIKKIRHANAVLSIFEKFASPNKMLLLNVSLLF